MNTCQSRSGGFPAAVFVNRRLGSHRSLSFIFLVLTAYNVAAQPIVVGSKKFTESYVLAEIAQRALRNEGLSAEHRQGMGGTIILWQALRAGQIDIYPEYTGTVADEILKTDRAASLSALREQLAPSGIGMTEPIGFNNTYALVMRRDLAGRLNISSISDLASHPELRFGLTHEFLDRKDGWRPLREHYGFPNSTVTGIDHGLGYAALVSGQIDVKDAYSTDAKISENDLLVLRDDRGFFPRYDAVYLYRLSLTAPALGALQKLTGRINEQFMTRLNAEAERSRNYARAADIYFNGSARTVGESFWVQLARWTARHLELTGLSLLLAIIFGVPLGIFASRGRLTGHFVLASVGILQTIPSLALLALLVPVPGFGISSRTAIAALFLYGLLPIVRNTATGLQEIPPAIRDSATALGLEPMAQLRKVYLPVASRSILAGIKTSAVIGIGTATLAALIGAGGLGEPILSGLNLNDHVTILKGAIPAALLALLVQGLFELLDRVFIPKGLRLDAAK